jgi:hypothetical protein
MPDVCAEPICSPHPATGAVLPVPGPPDPGSRRSPSTRGAIPVGVTSLPRERRILGPGVWPQRESPGPSSGRHSSLFPASKQSGRGSRKCLTLCGIPLGYAIQRSAYRGCIGNSGTTCDEPYRPSARLCL